VAVARPLLLVDDGSVRRPTLIFFFARAGAFARMKKSEEKQTEHFLFFSSSPTMAPQGD
jgi:hypothetical protein